MIRKRYCLLPSHIGCYLEQPEGRGIEPLPTGEKQKDARQQLNRYEQKDKEDQNTSRANAPHTIAHALQATGEFLGKDLVWEFSPDGKDIAKILPDLNREIPNLKDILKSKAQQGGVDQVNKFLKDNGFTIQLKDSGEKLAVYAATVMKLPVTWSDKLSAKKQSIYINDKEIPGINMDNVENIYKIAAHAHPIVKIPTQSADNVYITRFDEAPPKGSSGLYNLIKDWMKDIQKSPSLAGKDYTKNVRFPMVDFQNSGEITELLGASTLGTDGFPAVIDQAKYEHILKINEQGAIAEAAAAVGTSRGISIGPRSIYIDGPFLVWFERNGTIPFSAYITEKDMKEPQNMK